MPLRYSICCLYFATTLLTPIQAKAEPDSPVTKGLIVTGISGLSAIGGSLIGTVSGFTLGQMVSGNFAPVGLAVVGATVGAAIGAPLGAFAISDYAGVNKTTVTRNTAIVSSIGLVCSFVGILSLNDSLIFTGGGVLLASPLAAGVSAAYSPNSNVSIQSPSATAFSFSPAITPEYTGFVFGAQF